ncbi:hypothetical protein QVD17_37163 [Tagetes erecta]|uniref:Uncharacterized protein n=1 Tax=Tagetes erecta TaxID=13708 RepID=A0AAD8NJL1_TARER|nr:hypothetical protein QVD17_37163 [Tagetes erecta]
MTEPRSPRPITCKRDYLRQSVAAPLRDEYSSRGPDQPFRKAGKSESKTRQLTAPGGSAVDLQTLFLVRSKPDQFHNTLKLCSISSSPSIYNPDQ